MHTIALLLALWSPAASTVEGTVRAEGTLAPIAHATVEVPDLGRGVLTDRRGRFELAGLPEGVWTVRVRALGHRPHEAILRVPEFGAVRVEFVLETEPIPVAEVEVKGRSRPAAASGGDAERSAGPAPIRVDASVVAHVPALAEGDVLRAVQALPSVQAASDFSSALYVRGGLPNQNLLTLDGAPLFNPYHLGGLFSAFDPDATEWVGVTPGAFPAGIGDRLSSAVDVRTKEGGRDRVRAAGAVGLVSSRASANGPLPTGRGSFLVSARRTYLDLFSDAAHALGLIPGSLPYAFTDAHLKLTHDVGRAGRISASAYLDEEGLDFRASDFDPANASNQRATFGWGSRMVSLAYHQPLGRALTADVRAGMSDFRGTFGAWRSTWDNEAQEFSDTVATQVDAATAQRDLFAAADLTWRSGAHTGRFGAQADHYALKHVVDAMGEGLGQFVPEFRRAERPRTVAVYAEDEWSATGALALRGGVRVLHAGALGTAWMPRAGARYRLSPELSLSLGAGRSAQVLRSLRSEEAVWSSALAYDLLAAVPAESGLSTAEDVVLGVEWAAGGTQVRLDAYRKWMHDLPVAPPPADALEAPVVVPDSFQLAEGAARGVEVLARHARGRANFSLAYSLAFAELTAGGEAYPPRFHRRHVLDVSAALPWGEQGLLSTRLAWASGQPYTPVVGTVRGYAYDPSGQRFIDSRPGGAVILGEHNSARLPGYFRLDVGARRSFQRQWFGREVTLTPYLSVLNALNTPNVLFAVPEAYGAPRLTYTPQLPIFPTFGIEWSF